MDINSQPDPEERLNGFYALASAALGLISLCSAVLPALGCVMGAAGLLLGFLGRRSNRRKTALVGISFSIIGILTSVLYSVLVYLAQYSGS